MEVLDPRTGDEHANEGAGGIGREISKGMVAIYKEHMGRGPTKVRTSLRDDMVVTVLQDSLTKAEQKLRDSERAQLVRSIRREFQDTMRDDIVRLVEEKLDREVICMLSDHVPEPDYAVEVLILGPRPQAA